MKKSLAVNFTLCDIRGMTHLHERLKDHGLTASLVAERAGLSPSYLSMLLTGRRANPSASVIGRIVAASNGAITANDFLPRDSEAA